MWGPAETPAEVTYFPASTQRATLFHSTFGPCDTTQPNAAWLVAAGKPSSRPARASTAAPVQTDAMIRTLPSIACTQSSSAATSFGWFFFVEQRPRALAARDHQEIERLAPRALEIPIGRGKRTVAALDLVAVLAD